MIRVKYCITILFVLFFFCCVKEKRQDVAKTSKDLVKKAVKPISKTIVIQPFHGFSSSLVDTLHEKFRDVFADVSVKEAIALPHDACYEPRNRYRADSLVSFLWKQSTRKSIVLGLTNKDISVTKGKHKDWGVMGMAASIPGHSCVVSTFRLDKNKIHKNLYKVTIHELGHSDGLYHCNREKWCLMRDYMGGNTIDELTDFCSFCKEHLKRKGWKLN